MMRPLVILNSSSSVMRRPLLLHLDAALARGSARGAVRVPCAGSPSWSGRDRCAKSGRPLDLAAGRAFRRGRLVACDDLIDAEQILGIACRLGQRLADERRRHQLVVALAVVALVRLQLDVVGELITA